MIKDNVCVFEADEYFRSFFSILKYDDHKKEAIFQEHFSESGFKWKRN